MEQSRKVIQTGSANTQRTKFSAAEGANFKQQNPSQNQPQHSQPGQKTGSNNPQQKNLHGKYEGRDQRGDKR